MPDLEVNKVDLKDCLYPKLLAAIPEAPDPLYFLGDFKASIFEKTLAVVGSRSMTAYGEWVVNNIVSQIAQAGITVVSGFMYGVDALAHKVALDSGGSTVAVMAGGVDYIFPAYQKDLYWEIAHKGMVVSEFHRPDFGGKWMFARRNRIVAGLSHGVLVVEAAEQSGSLITVSDAKQYGRRVYSVPGNVNSPYSVGTLNLIKSGATLVTRADDILKDFFDNPKDYQSLSARAVNKRLKLDDDGGLAERVLALLRKGSLDVDCMSCRLNVEPARVLEAVTTLSLSGCVGERGGKYYAI